MIVAAALFAAVTLAEPPAVAQAHTNLVEAQRAAAQARREYQAARKEAGMAPARTRPAAPAPKKVLSKDAQKFLENRRICVSRDVTSVPGSVITTWYRNGKPDTQLPAVVTNVIRAVHGAAQTSPLADLAERWRESAAAYSNRWASAYADYVSMSNRWTLSEQSASALRSSLETSRAEYVDKRDKAALQTTKAIYQLFIDSIDRMLNGGGQ